MYFDNVGGEILDHALARLTFGSRIVLCGAISQYNNLGERNPVGPKNYFNLILNGARMEGFLVFHFLQRYPEAIAEMSKWYAEGKLKNQIDLAARTRERAEDDHPAVHRRKFRQAIVEAG